jgi:hypothetical protein
VLLDIILCDNLTNKRHMMKKQRIVQSRYLAKCPVCAVTFDPSEIEAPIFAPHFPCPKCGEELEYPVRHAPVMAIFSGLVAVGLPFVLGLRGVTYVLSAIVAFPVAWLVTMAIVGNIDPPHEARRHQKFVPDGKLSLNMFKPTDKRKP